ncbi:MAG: hypothetical protein IJ655_02740 [Lachnospiraceae bacterium]|nr:hypothetical protein [Lachnospiraceae bacterium]
MIEIAKSIIVLVIMMSLFYIWGRGTTELCGIKTRNVALMELLGLCLFFVVQQIVVQPLVFTHNSLHVTAIVDAIVVIVISGILVYVHTSRRSVAGKIFYKLNSVQLLFAAVGILATICMMIVAYNMMYRGYDTSYYIGIMNSFVYDGKFWTRDGFRGLWPTDFIPLHYAISCYYPVWSIVAYITGIPVRIFAMFSVKGLLIVLFSCVCFCYGYELLGDHIKEGEDNRWLNRFNLGFAFISITALVSLFLSEEHSLVGMMYLRGYESKGYCAAVVCPLCLLILIKICKNPTDDSLWKMLAVVAWSSMPIAMSSMAIIPLAIGIVGVILMVTEKRFWPIFIRCLICVIPNIAMMAWYMLGK